MNSWNYLFCARQEELSFIDLNQIRSEKRKHRYLIAAGRRWPCRIKPWLNFLLADKLVDHWYTFLWLCWLLVIKQASSSQYNEPSLSYKRAARLPKDEVRSSPHTKTPALIGSNSSWICHTHDTRQESISWSTVRPTPSVSVWNLSVCLWAARQRPNRLVSGQGLSWSGALTAFSRKGDRILFTQTHTEWERVGEKRDGKVECVESEIEGRRTGCWGWRGQKSVCVCAECWLPNIKLRHHLRAWTILF